MPSVPVDPTAPAEPVPGGGSCLPCRGSGQVMSQLGGTARSVPCPWCEGTGARQPGVDAQASWREAAAGEEPTASAATDAEPSVDAAGS